MIQKCFIKLLYSLFTVPELVSANTNAAAIMIGERGADFIKEDYARKPKTEL